MDTICDEHRIDTCAICAADVRFDAISEHQYAQYVAMKASTPSGMRSVPSLAAMRTAPHASSSAAPTIHSERRKFVPRRPIAFAPSNEMQTMTTTAAAATIHRNRCAGRGVQMTARISP